MQQEGFIRSYRIEPEKAAGFAEYPFSIPAVRSASEVELGAQVTFLVGENGSGKSTLIEAIAVCAGFNPEGGTINFNFETRRTESELSRAMTLIRNPRRERTGFFLRAESFYNVATNIDDIGGVRDYGGTSLHEQSHGESFMALVRHRFGDSGLYVLDEPEAALSPAKQLELLRRMHGLCAKGSQFIIATHSPVLLAYPGALIYLLDAEGMKRTIYEETPHYVLTRDFLNHTELYLKRLFES